MGSRLGVNLTLGLIASVGVIIGCKDEQALETPAPEITSSFASIERACDSSFYAFPVGSEHIRVVGFYQSWGCRYNLGFRDWTAIGDQITIDLDLYTAYGHDCFEPPCAGTRYIFDMTRVPPGNYSLKVRYYKTTFSSPTNPVWETAWEDSVHVPI